MLIGEDPHWHFITVVGSIGFSFGQIPVLTLFSFFTKISREQCVICVCAYSCGGVSQFQRLSQLTRLGRYVTPVKATPAPHLVLMAVVTWRNHELLSRGSDTSPACFVVRW